MTNANLFLSNGLNNNNNNNNNNNKHENGVNTKNDNNNDTRNTACNPESSSSSSILKPYHHNHERHISSKTGGNVEKEKEEEEEEHDAVMQHAVQQYQLSIHRQNSIRFSNYKKVVHNDLESRINRMYSFLLVKYHWVFILLGVFICLVFTGVGFVKQPLPSFLDPKKGFGARGEGTLTSQLIVMKNINKELIEYQKYILDVYEKVKRANRSDYIDIPAKNPSSSSPSSSVDDYEYPAYDYNYNYDEEDEDEDYINYDHLEETEEETLKRRRRRRRIRKKRDSPPLPIRENLKILDDRIFKGLSGHDIIKLMPLNLSLPSVVDEHDNKKRENEYHLEQKYYAFESIEHCHIYLGLNKNLEFYFGVSDSQAQLAEEEEGEEEEGEGGEEGEEERKEIPPLSSPSPSKKSDHNDYFTDIDAEFSYNDDKYLKQFQNIHNPSEEQIKLKKSYLRSKEKSLLNVKNLKSLCKWEKKMLDLLIQSAMKEGKTTKQVPCHFSLPMAIAIINNKTDCMHLTPNDVRTFLGVCRECHPLQKQGLLYLAAEDSKTKSKMVSLLTKTDPVSRFFSLPFIQENICFKKNLMYMVFEYLVDIHFMSIDKFKQDMDDKDNDDDDLLEMQTYTVHTATLLISNDIELKTQVNSTEEEEEEEPELYNNEFVFNFYLHNIDKQYYDDDLTTLKGVNLMGIREEAAMRFITQEMTLIALAILLIVSATLLYLKSIVISMMINISVGMAIGVAFFVYRIVFDIELFPFLNMMAAFLLLGIACDDVFVLFDSWYNEKAKIIMEDLPEMIEKQYESMDHTHSDVSGGSSNGNVIKDIQGSQIVVPQKSSSPPPLLSVEELLMPPMFIERKFIDSYNDDKSKKMKSLSQLDTLTNNDDERTHNNKNKNNKNKDENNEENENFMSSSKKLSLRKNSEINIELQDAGISLDRLSDYMLNPGYIQMAILTDEQMIRVMGGTLRHAASSIFVTSFTTAAAFLSNYITKLPYVQLFGVFTGTCILIYFTMVITMVAAFVIMYEKHINLWRCKLKPRFTLTLERQFNRFMDKVALMNYCTISKNLPKFLIRFRFLFFCIFFVLGVCGLVAVFYKPQLKPPENWKYQFFQDGNYFENFEFGIKDNTLAYVNEEKRNLTNPEVFIVFGIHGKDTGSVFDPDDDGYLEYDTNFDFIDPVSQVWLNDFINISLANRTDLFLGAELVKEWNDYLFNIQQLCWKTLDLDPLHIFTKIFLPYERQKLSKCRDEIGMFMQNSSIRNFESMMGSFPRRIIFIAKGNDITGVLLRVNANRTFASYQKVDEYYKSVNEFTTAQFAQAPQGFNSGWFISVGFALFDLQTQLIAGTYASLVVAMSVALLILLLTSGNLIISILAIITISFSIADTVAVFVFLGWRLDCLESVIIIMSVGLSVDFSCHYGVAYINADTKCLTDTTLNSIFTEGTNAPANPAPCNQKNTTKTQNENNSVVKGLMAKNSNNKDNSMTAGVAVKSSSTRSLNKSQNKVTSFFKKWKARYHLSDRERFVRVEDIFSRVGSAVLMAAVTTFLAGTSMFPSGLISFSKMGQFLMLVMCNSYLFATFFFVPMCAIFGPTKDFGKFNLKKMSKRFFKKCCMKCSRKKKHQEQQQQQQQLKINSNTINEKHLKIPLTNSPPAPQNITNLSTMNTQITVPSSYPYPSSSSSSSSSPS